MTAAPDITDLPQWATLRGWLDQQRAAADGLGAFIRRQSGELEALRQLMTERETELDAWERALEVEQSTFTQQWQHLESMRRTAEAGAHHVRHEARRLDELRSTLEAEREATAALATDRTTGDESKSGRERLARVTEERNALTRELAEARAQITALARATLELADARKEVGRLRVQVARQQARLAHARGHLGRDSQASLRSLEVERTRLAEQLAFAEQQALESQRQLDAQRRESARERTSWTDELTRLRSALETQSQVLATRAGVLDFGRSVDTADAALADIIGQLEQMQQEMARCEATNGVTQETS